MTEENNDTTVETPAAETPPVETPEAPGETTTETKTDITKKPTLTGDDKAVTKPALTDTSTHDAKANEDYAFDERLFDKETGAFNKDGAKAFFDEKKAETEKYEKRIADMRKLVSTKDEVVKDKAEYFQDFAPPEKYMKYFVPETPEETKEIMTGMQDKLAGIYHDLALSKGQSLGVSNAILEVMEEMGVLDTRTDAEKYADDQKFIEAEKKKLGANAEEIITESKIFIHNAPFTAKVKNYMLDMINTQGADFVDVVNQMKSSFGNATGGVPGSVSSLQGLPSDAELAEEYKTASNARKDEILVQRRQAGRKGKLQF